MRKLIIRNKEQLLVNIPS